MATKKKSNVRKGPDPDDKIVHDMIMSNPNRPKSLREQREAAEKKTTGKGKK